MLRMAYIRATKCITAVIATLRPPVLQAILRYKVTAPNSVVIHFSKITETLEKQYQVLRIPL